MGPFKKKLLSLALALPLREHLLAIMRRPAYEKRQIVAKRVAEAWDAASEKSTVIPILETIFARRN
ncbi:hypothetical protein PHMEG_00015133 [Phytophthora megakarya]|uniref:DDE-1 domain-containing protein n=1 Tax=Phytophthora megakarya TaxID=4795 RepID=A0A225W238_9STRA|nr:hypothetical protein PHMEG_00015133 [Phytophthora megakarya]